jgi:PIN domain nuclease of toxin-antitoxin system
MKLLLDTHTVLWFINGDTQLSTVARQLIEDAANTSYVSAASFWEMAIKISLGKLKLQHPFDAFMTAQMQQNNFLALGITISHTGYLSTLPFPLIDHRDPFDRLLIAQAIIEQMAIISRDAKFDAYPVSRLW